MYELPEVVDVIDSHTGGEPTRVVVSGAPDLGSGSMEARRQRFAQHCDAFRRGVILEPRGSEVLVGALLLPASDVDCVAGTIFFNNVGYLGMCGHGTIGLMATLYELGRIGTGDYKLETPVGLVDTTVHSPRRVSIRNVLSYRYRAGVVVNVPELGRIEGDIAYGGNWFFLVDVPGEEISMQHCSRWLSQAQAIRRALDEQAIRGAAGAVIDHVELSSGGKNFVLCPGGSYDRSPCGTGTSAKVACLAASGRLAPGEVWRQESITGSVFEASYERSGAGVIPTITGDAFITGHNRLLFRADDPLRLGL